MIFSNTFGKDWVQRECAGHMNNVRSVIYSANDMWSV